LAAKEDGGVDASATNVDAYTSEGIAGTLAHEQDIADTRAFWVVFCEEAGSCGGRVE
jgi:hypothetical protein